VAGLVNPPLSPGMRSLWSAYADHRLAHAAFGLDAAVFDLAYITRPVLASVLLTLTRAAVIAIGKQPDGHPPGAKLSTSPPASERASAPGERSRPGPLPAWTAPGLDRSRPGPLRSVALRELLVTAAPSSGSAQ
jgi:hypothetical protein